MIPEKPVSAPACRRFIHAETASGAVSSKPGRSAPNRKQAPAAGNQSARRVSAFFGPGRLPSLSDPEFADAVVGASGPDRLRIPLRTSLNECLVGLGRAVGADDGGDARLVSLEWHSRTRRIIVEMSAGDWRAREVTARGRPRVAPNRRSAAAVFLAYEIQARELKQALAHQRSHTRRSLERAMPEVLRGRVVTDEAGEVFLLRLGRVRPVMLARRGDLSVAGLWTVGLYELVVALTAAHFDVSPGTIRSMGLGVTGSKRARFRKPRT